jgi:hypothetical protein
MELRRKEKKEVQVGDYCKINHNQFRRDFYQDENGFENKYESYGRNDRNKSLKILDVSNFIIIESIFGGNKKALVPLTLKDHDFYGISITKFLKTRKFFYIDDKYLEPVSSTSAFREMNDKNRESLNETITKFLNSPFTAKI